MAAVPREAEDSDALLASRDRKPPLRFVICGSVGDGKSTLLARLLQDSRTVLRDRSQATERESRSRGARGDGLDSALPLDGLQAKGRQGAIVEVAYRIFESDRRKFMAIDVPGHEQDTPNLVSGASNADLALLLIDARKGIVTRTRRHSHVVSLTGIRQVILAVNKMDLVGYRQALFSSIVDDYTPLARELGIEQVHAVPLSALTGENVLARQNRAPWYDGPALMELLETVETGADGEQGPFRLPVRRVVRPDPEFRGLCGTVASGRIERGMPVLASPSGQTAAVERLLGPSGELERAVAGQSITLVLPDGIDASPGDMISGTDRPPEVADQFAAHLIWMDGQPMLPERSYLARFASASALARVTDLVHRVDVDTLGRLAAKTLALNEIGYCKISLDRPVPFDSHGKIRRTGAFVLIDRSTKRNRGRGQDRLRTPPRRQPRLAGTEDRQGGAGAGHRPETLRPLADRPFGSRKVDHRRPTGTEAASARQAHLCARRRQRPARAEPGPGLHRPGPGGKHPPGLRSRQADGRCRADGDRLLYLSVPIGTGDGAEPDGGG